MMVADAAKGMHVTIANPAPIPEFDSQFDGALRFANEVVLVQTEGLVIGLVPIASDSMSVIESVSLNSLANRAAVIHPAVPPPTITRFRIRSLVKALFPVGRQLGRQIHHLD
jgi:hypothetical protein